MIRYVSYFGEKWIFSFSFTLRVLNACTKEGKEG